MELDGEPVAGAQGGLSVHKVAFPQWLTTTKRYVYSFETLEAARTALIVVDLQNFFLDPAPDGMDFAYAREIVPIVNDLAAAMRRAGGLVVFTRHTIAHSGPRAMPAWQVEALGGAARQGPNSALTPGARGHEVHPQIVVTPDDLIVDKYRPSAFLPNSSDIDALLRERGIDTLIITGAATNACCESSARDAQMLDYRVIFVSDATAAFNDDLHNAALLNLKYLFADVVQADVVLERLARAGNVVVG
jgi:ureidoacrylate peracid hydrolase